MIVDGKAIAADIYREIENTLSQENVRPHLTVFTCAPHFETKKYLELKKRKAEQLGIGINVIEFPEYASGDDMRSSLLHSLMQTDGVIVQLPFPSHVAINDLLREIPNSYDVDAVRYDGTQSAILPPVVGAIAEIMKQHDILFATQRVTIVGHGRLVGQPAALWAQKQGAQVAVITKESTDTADVIADSDILILGAGSPHFLKPDMVKEGVFIFDAGTSEDGGVLQGDADPACAEKAALFTPVPGGIGPITVALLFRNLLRLTRHV